MFDTIAAVSTGLSVSAIGIIRLTGDDCANVAGKVFELNNGQSLPQAKNRQLVLGTLHDQQGRVIDQCCAIYSRAPHTYTGEDTVNFTAMDRLPCWQRGWKVFTQPAQDLPSGASLPNGHF